MPSRDGGLSTWWQATAGMQAVPSTCKLVGRIEELDRLHAVLDAARAGASAFVLVQGEAGIGKTHLARQFLADAEEQGFRVGFGRAWDGRGAPAFFVWSAAFESAGRPLALTRTMAADGAAFAAIERVAQHVQTIAREMPLAIVLDDLQWADAPTLNALRLLVRATAGRFVVVATLRMPELVEPATGGLLQEVVREATAVLTLGGLPEHDLRALPESSGVDETLIGAIHRACGGNPFFAKELLLDQTARAALAAGREPLLSRGTAALLARRFTTLGEYVDVVGAAALGPQPKLDSELISRALRLPPDRVAAALEVALDGGFVVRGTDGTLRFAHDLMRTAAAEQLAAERRSDVHRGWAQALEATPDAHLAIAGAFHAIAAEPASEQQPLRDRVFAAGCVALDQMSYAAAVTLFEFAANADERAGRKDLAGCSLARLAEAVTYAGDPQRGYAVAERAVTLAREANAPTALAHAALALGLRRRLGGTDQTLIGVLDEALRALEAAPAANADVALHCALEARLAAALQPFVDPPRALGLARAAIARARVTRDERLLARTLHGARPAFRILDDLDERLTMDSELLYLATTHGDKVLAAQARERLCFLSIERGDRLELDSHLDALRGLADELRLAQYELGVASLLALRAAIRGNLATASTLIDQIETKRSRWSTAHSVPAVDPVTILRGALGVVSGDAAAYTALAVAPAPPLAHSMFVLFAALRCNRLREAAEVHDKVAETVLSPDSANFVFRAVFGNSVIALRDVARAKQLYPLLAPYAGRHVIWTPFPLYDGTIDRLRAGLAAVLGDRDAAERHFADALAAEEAFGAEPFARRTHLEREAALAAVPIDAADPGSRASRIEERVRTAAQRWQLTPRTTEVLELLVAGHATATIAQLLGISTRAVELHVSRLFDIAGVDGRAALVARVLVG